MPTPRRATKRKQTVFKNYPSPPERSSELFVAIRDNPDTEPVIPGNPTQYQVNLGGTKRALRALGTYLIALSELDNGDREPYQSLDDVRNQDGGTIRLILRRSSKPPKRRPRNRDYKAAVCN
jgi:hypothetical protein